MEFDIFFSISQTPDTTGYTPSETEMFSNFFDQVELAEKAAAEQRLGGLVDVHVVHGVGEDHADRQVSGPGQQAPVVEGVQQRLVGTVAGLDVVAGFQHAPGHQAEADDHRIVKMKGLTSPEQELPNAPSADAP